MRNQWNSLKCPKCGYMRKHKKDHNIRRTAYGAIYCYACDKLTTFQEILDMRTEENNLQKEKIAVSMISEYY